MSAAAKILESYLDAFPDLDRVAELMHDDIEFELVAPPPQHRINQGKERIAGGLQREFEKFYLKESFDLNVQLVFGDERYAAARYTITAETRLGPYHNSYAIFVEVEDGKVRRGWEHSDTMNAAIQIGEAWQKAEAERKVAKDR